MATPEQMEATMLANLEAKTGQALAHWLQLVAKSGLDKHGKIVAHLKQEHGLTHGYANLVAHHHLRSAASTAPPCAGCCPRLPSQNCAAPNSARYSSTSEPIL